jgi:hypothetical protein
MSAPAGDPGRVPRQTLLIHSQAPVLLSVFLTASPPRLAPPPPPPRKALHTYASLPTNSSSPHPPSSPACISLSFKLLSLFFTSPTCIPFALLQPTGSITPHTPLEGKRKEKKRQEKKRKGTTASYTLSRNLAQSNNISDFHHTQIKMLASSILVLAAGVLGVSASYDTGDSTTLITGTTTSTSTLYATVTITKCNPTNTACPLYSSSSVVPTTSAAPNTTVSYPTYNTTSAYYPTASAWYNVSSSITKAASSSKATSLATTPVVATTKGSTTTYPASAATTSGTSTSGAMSNVARSGMMLGVLGAAVAFLA